MSLGMAGCPLARVAEEERRKKLSPKVEVLVWTGSSCPGGKSPEDFKWKGQQVTISK